MAPRYHRQFKATLTHLEEQDEPRSPPPMPTRAPSRIPTTATTTPATSAVPTTMPHHALESTRAYTISPPANRASKSSPPTCIGDLPAPLLRRIIFGHLDHIPSRSALARASPSVVIKAMRREGLVPLVQMDDRWYLKRLQLELVLRDMRGVEILVDALWWRKWTLLRAGIRKGVEGD